MIPSLTDDHWKRLSLGDYDNLIEEARRLGSKELEEYFLSCLSHTKNKDDFRKRYEYGSNEEIPFPPEYYNNFDIDSRIQTILKFIQKYDAKNILDIGSRAGYLLFHALTRNLIESADGIEVDTRFYTLCNRAVEHFNIKGAKFHNVLFEDFECDEKFDAIVLTDILEHVIDPQKIVSKSRNFIKDTGIMVISLPVDRPPIMDHEKKVIEEIGTQEHVHLIQLDSIIKIAENAEYNHVETETMTSFWLTNISVFKPNL